MPRFALGGRRTAPSSPVTRLGFALERPVARDNGRACGFDSRWRPARRPGVTWRFGMTPRAAASRRRATPLPGWMGWCSTLCRATSPTTEPPRKSNCTSTRIPSSRCHEGATGRAWRAGRSDGRGIRGGVAEGVRPSEPGLPQTKHPHARSSRRDRTGYASSPRMTAPWTSVSRRLAPLWRTTRRSWSMPSRCSTVA